MNMKLVGLVIAAVATVSGTSFAESLTFMGSTEKNPLEYKLNETIKFSVTLVDKDNGNAPVAGKELQVFNRRAFGKKTKVEFARESNGTMNLSYVGSMTVGSLVIEGVEQPIGTYGSPTSAAQFNDARFTGSGILRVGKLGEYIILR